MVAQAKVIDRKISQKDIISLYEAFPGAFDPAPQTIAASERDSFIPRGTVRVKFMDTATVPASILRFLCPSPLCTQTNQAIDSGMPGTAPQWLGSYSCPAASSTPSLPNDTDVWVNCPTTVGADKIVLNRQMSLNMDPQNQFGSYQAPQALCGGFACLTVTLPYNASCNVYCVGPTDSSTVQGILTGDFWRQNTQQSNAIEPRRQCYRSAQFHARNGWQTIKSALNPIPLVGSSEVSQHFFGFAIVPDSQFTPNQAIAAALNTAVSPDFYPSGNFHAGQLSGQGCFYIENTGPVDISYKLEYYVDYCVSINEVAQRYVTPSMMAIGSAGLSGHPAYSAMFPGLDAPNCRELLYKMITLRLPPGARKTKTLAFARKLLDGYFAKAAIVATNQSRLVQSTLDTVESALKSVGTAAEHAVEDVVTDIEHPIDTTESIVKTVAHGVKDVWDWFEKEI